MRFAVVALLALAAGGCGNASQSSRPARLLSPSKADATRAQ
jgi:hypothetical protein